jgi:hypothetical protein
MVAATSPLPPHLSPAGRLASKLRRYSVGLGPRWCLNGTDLAALPLVQKHIGGGSDVTYEARGCL